MIEKQVIASFVGIADIRPPVDHREFGSYMMNFFPVPVLRKQTKRGRLRWQGKMRHRERIRRFYESGHAL